MSRFSPYAVAFTSLGFIASQMRVEMDTSGNSVRYADLRTSLCDWRIALHAAIETPLHLIDRNGMSIATAESRAYWDARRAKATHERVESLRGQS